MTIRHNLIAIRLTVDFPPRSIALQQYSEMVKSTSRLFLCLVVVLVIVVVVVVEVIAVGQQ